VHGTAFLVCGCPLVRVMIFAAGPSNDAFLLLCRSPGRLFDPSFRLLPCRLCFLFPAASAEFWSLSFPLESYPVFFTPLPALDQGHCAGVLDRFFPGFFHSAAAGASPFAACRGLRYNGLLVTSPFFFVRAGPVNFHILYDPTTVCLPCFLSPFIPFVRRRDK